MGGGKRLPLKKEVGWYKNAIFYQIHVRTFLDSNSDGIGDFQGLAQKLDYVRDLGVDAIWLMPFFPSPLKDDGYDISDFYGVLPQYGTLNDFREFLKEAHDRGMRVITELILNHTSDQHSWFKKSRVEPPGSEWRELYTWSDSSEKCFVMSRCTGITKPYGAFVSPSWIEFLVLT